MIIAIYRVVQKNGCSVLFLG